MDRLGFIDSMEDTFTELGDVVSILECVIEKVAFQIGCDTNEFYHKLTTKKNIYN